MKNHKWKDTIEYEMGTKPQVCTRCSINRKWQGGDYKCWEYWWATYFVAANGTKQVKIHESWDRPNCETIPSVIKINYD